MKNLQVGYRIQVRLFPKKLREGEIETILNGGWVGFRPDHSSKIIVLKEGDEVLKVWDAAGNAL